MPGHPPRLALLGRLPFCTSEAPLHNLEESPFRSSRSRQDQTVLWRHLVRLAFGLRTTASPADCVTIREVVPQPLHRRLKQRLSARISSRLVYLPRPRRRSQRSSTWPRIGPIGGTERWRSLWRKP